MGQYALLSLCVVSMLAHATRGQELVKNPNTLSSLTDQNRDGLSQPTLRALSDFETFGVAVSAPHFPVAMRTELEREVQRLHAAKTNAAITGRCVYSVQSWALQRSEPPFPQSVVVKPEARKPLPVVLLPDPKALRNWLQTQQAAQEREPYITSDANNARAHLLRIPSISVVYFAPPAAASTTQCGPVPLSHLTKPDEADKVSSSLGLSLGKIFGQEPAITNIIWPCVGKAASETSLVSCHAVTDRVWLLPKGQRLLTDGEMVFPLWDAVGGKRDTTPTRYTARVKCEAVPERLNGESMLIVPVPRPRSASFKGVWAQERLCVLERMLTEATPIWVIRLAPGSQPFREDYIVEPLTPGQPVQDPLAVCVFSGAADEQLVGLMRWLVQPMKEPSDKSNASQSPAVETPATKPAP
ncbi:MAG: hypothetical protein IBJ18_09485 [Phycisphaerales bacterium]|nr:hypothetical protein [Phycisphaerales bacterium]